MTSSYGKLALLGIAATGLIFSGCRDGGSSTQDPVQEQGNFTPTQQLVESSPEWFSCRTDADCVAEQGVCASWNAVNKNFVTNFHDYVARMEAEMTCSSPKTVQADAPSVGCLQNRCTVREDAVKQPGPPSADYPTDSGPVSEPH